MTCRLIFVFDKEINPSDEANSGPVARMARELCCHAQDLGNDWRIGGMYKVWSVLGSFLSRLCGGLKPPTHRRPRIDHVLDHLSVLFCIAVNQRRGRVVWVVENRPGLAGIFVRFGCSRSNVVLYLHNEVVDRSQDELLFRLAQGVRTVFVCSERQRKVLDTYFENVVVVPNFPPAYVHSTNRPRTALSAPSVKIAFLGRISHQKGVDLFLDAAEALNLRIDNLSFLVVGGAGPKDSEQFSNAMRQKANRLLNSGLDISWAGQIEHRRIAGILVEVDILVVPSRGTEASPLSLIEGIVSGCIPIGSNVGGIPEILTDAEFLMKGQDVASVVDRVVWILKNRDVAIRRASQIRSHCLRRFAVENAALEVAKAVG